MILVIAYNVYKTFVSYVLFQKLKILFSIRSYFCYCGIQSIKQVYCVEQFVPLLNVIQMLVLTSFMISYNCQHFNNNLCKQNIKSLSKLKYVQRLHIMYEKLYFDDAKLNCNLYFSLRILPHIDIR